MANDWMPTEEMVSAALLAHHGICTDVLCRSQIKDAIIVVQPLIVEQAIKDTLPNGEGVDIELDKMMLSFTVEEYMNSKMPPQYLEKMRHRWKRVALSTFARLARPYLDEANELREKQPLIAAEALDNFGVKQNHMLGVVEYTGEMAAIITRAQAEASTKEQERILKIVLEYWNADLASNIRAMIQKEPGT